MELQLRQGFGSPSADLGVMATLLPGLFASRGRLTTSRKADSPGSASAPDRAKVNDEGYMHLQPEEVVERLRRGEHLTPRDAVAAFNLGWAYKTLGRWSESAEAFTKAIDFLAQDESKYRDRNLATAYYMRAYAYASLATKQEGEDARQNFEKAEHDYLEATKLKNDDVLVYCYLGVLYGVQGRWRDAEKALKKAIKLKPRYSGAHHDLGAIYMQSERPNLALKAFEKAVEYEPRNLLSLKHLGEAYYDAERWEDAKRLFQRVLKLDPEDQDALYKLGGSYLHLGDFWKAEEALKKVLNLDPDDAVAYSNLGIVYVKSERLGEAAEAFNRALELKHPDSEGIRSSLNAVQLTMLEVVGGVYLELLKYGIPLDVESLVGQVAKVWESVSGAEANPLKAPSAYFPNQLTLVLAPLVEQLDEEARFLLAAKLFERNLLSSGKAARMVGLPRVTFLSDLNKAGVAMINLSPEELEEEFSYASAE